MSANWSASTLPTSVRTSGSDASALPLTSQALMLRRYGPLRVLTMTELRPQLNGLGRNTLGRTEPWVSPRQRITRPFRHLFSIALQLGGRHRRPLSPKSTQCSQTKHQRIYKLKLRSCAALLALCKDKLCTGMLVPVECGARGKVTSVIIALSCVDFLAVANATTYYWYTTTATATAAAAAAPAPTDTPLLYHCS